MKDRFGNDVTASSALFTFEGRASGPGGVTVEQSTSSDGGVQFEFKTTVAASTRFPRRGRAWTRARRCPVTHDVGREPEKSPPPGAPRSLQTITGATKGRRRRRSLGVVVAMAGEEITCLVDAPRSVRNATVWSGESAAVIAHGPAHNPADRAFDVVDVRGGRAGLRGVLPRAGVLHRRRLRRRHSVRVYFLVRAARLPPGSARRPRACIRATRYPGCPRRSLAGVGADGG